MLTPNKHIRELAREYVASKGFNPITEGHYVALNVERAKDIARAYESAPLLDDSHEVMEAYEQLKREVTEQYFFIQSHGYTLQQWPDVNSQPYANSKEMHCDLLQNMHLWYFVGGEEHPVLGYTNYLFRAVHDFFGHGAEGYSFGARGEENAWIHHSMMFTALAQEALTTETRGQNSWFNNGPACDLSPSERPFAEQKTFLFNNPDWFDYWSEL